MVKLKRLKIIKYRNVRPGTELHFDDLRNLVLGRNGSGKTTLLGLISTVVSLDFSALEEEPFELEAELHSDDTLLILKIFSAGTPEADVPDAVEDLERHASHSDLHYEARITDSATPNDYQIVGSRHETRVVLESEDHPVHSLAGLGLQSFRPGFLSQSILELSDDAIPELDECFNTLQLSFEYSHSFRFDEGLDCFLAMTGRTPAIAAVRTPISSRFTAVFRNGVGKSPYVTSRQRVFTPRATTKIVPRAHENPAGELFIPAAGTESIEGLEFLKRAASLMGFAGAGIRPEIKQITPSRLGKSFDTEGFSFSFKRQDGTELRNHDHLSFGQKRLLAFLYYLEAIDHVVIADELVNGLHHKWIDACVTAIGDRQAFLTSQNPLLFDYIPEFESIEQVESRFITCRSETVDGAEQLVWENMPREHAAIFFEAYKDDIEQVGEILIARGLW